MKQMDLKFFTNEEHRSLYDRFTVVLNNYTQFFDVLVGYFRTSGFFKLYKAMEDIDKNIVAQLSRQKSKIFIMN